MMTTTTIATATATATATPTPTPTPTPTTTTTTKKISLERGPWGERGPRARAKGLKIEAIFGRARARTPFTSRTPFKGNFVYYYFYFYFHFHHYWDYQLNLTFKQNFRKGSSGRRFPELRRHTSPKPLLPRGPLSKEILFHIHVFLGNQKIEPRKGAYNKRSH